MVFYRLATAACFADGCSANISKTPIDSDAYLALFVMPLRAISRGKTEESSRVLARVLGLTPASPSEIKRA